jgi:hypothetical protein
MMTRNTSKLAAVCAVISLTGLIYSGHARAEKGVISQVNRKCFSIATPSGFVLVRGSIGAPVGATVEGPLNTFGAVPIFDRSGVDLTGGTARTFDENGNEVDESAYIEDFGLTDAGLRDKWSFMCEG